MSTPRRRTSTRSVSIPTKSLTVASSFNHSRLPSQLHQPRSKQQQDTFTHFTAHFTTTTKPSRTRPNHQSTRPRPHKQPTSTQQPPLHTNTKRPLTTSTKGKKRHNPHPSPHSTSRRNVGHARGIVEDRIKERKWQQYTSNNWKHNLFEWDLGSQWLRFPTHLQRELESRGYFPQQMYHYLEQSERKFYDPYIGELMMRRTIPFHAAANYQDAFVHLKTRDLSHSDYPQYVDEFKARQANIGWDIAPLLFEKIVATRRRPLYQVDSLHQTEVMKIAPFSGITPDIDQYGEWATFPEPPNGPVKPRRPQLKSPYPWVAPKDLDHVHFGH